MNRHLLAASLIVCAVTICKDDNQTIYYGNTDTGGVLHAGKTCVKQQGGISSYPYTASSLMQAKKCSCYHENP